MKRTSSIIQFWFKLKKDLRHLFASRSFAFAFILLMIFIFFGFVLSYFCPQNPQRWGLVPGGLPPSFKYPLGTTTLGQDVFWLMTYAIRNSMILGIITASLSIGIAMIMGFLAGHLSNNIVGEIINMIIDSFCVIPGLPVLLILSFVLRKYINIVLVALILVIFGWAWPAKQLRSIILNIKERTFVRTAVCSGFSIPKILLREYMPFALPWLLMQFLGLINWSIGMETTIAIFGLSTMETATIGTTIYWAMNYQALFLGKWWWIASPIVMVVLLIISLYLVSINISEYLNPQIRLGRMQEKE